MLRVTTLMDNQPSENKALAAEHGLAYWVETGGMRFLFDCGASDGVIRNAHRLGVPLAEADFTVCSHSHYDHAAGFRDLAERGLGGKTLITGPGFWKRKYAFDGLKYTDLSAGFGPEFLAVHGIEHRVCEGVLPLAEGCWLVGDFPRVHPFEVIQPRFVRGEPGAAEPDDFSDEICLAVDTPQGLVVLVGCSHPGILNMIARVHEALHRPVYGVFGGTHLVEADEARIRATLEELRGMGLRILGLSHCSGALAEQCLHSDGRVTACHMAVGDCLAL